MEKTVTEEKIEASHSRQILAGMVDVAMPMLFVVSILIYQQPLFLYKILTSLNSTVVVFLCLICYRLVGLFIFKKTIGMKMFRVILLNGKEQSLSRTENLLAAIFILYKGTDYYHQ